MNFWSDVATTVLSSILSSVVFVIIALCALKWFAIKVVEQVNKSIEGAAKQAGLAAEEQIRRILAEKGIDAQSLQDKSGQ